MLDGWQDFQQLELALAKWGEKFESLPGSYLPLRRGSYRVGFNPRMRTRAGVCRGSQSLIEINPHLIKSPEVLEEVLVHELCHLAVYRRFPFAQSHGKKWKTLMQYFGFEPKRCHTLGAERARKMRKFLVRCGCKEHQISTVIWNRLQRGLRYQCKKCLSFLYV